MLVERRISKRGIDLIKEFEGLRLTAYKALPNEELYTIGYGHYGLADSTMTITEQEAEDLLVKDLEKAETRVNKYMDIYRFNQNQFDALVSFAHNVGSINKLTNNGKRTIKEIVKAFPKYNKSGGKTIQGLVIRRAIELDLFVEPVEIESEKLEEVIILEKTFTENIQAVLDVLDGKYGNGDERKLKLTQEGFNAENIQNAVNLILKWKNK